MKFKLSLPKTYNTPAYARFVALAGALVLTVKAHLALWFQLVPFYIHLYNATESGLFGCVLCCLFDS